MKALGRLLLVLAILIVAFMATSLSQPIPGTGERPSGNESRGQFLRLHDGSGSRSQGGNPIHDLAASVDSLALGEPLKRRKKDKTIVGLFNKVMAGIFLLYTEPPPVATSWYDDFTKLWELRAVLIEQASPRLKEKMEALAKEKGEWELWKGGVPPQDPNDFPPSEASVAVPSSMKSKAVKIFSRLSTKSLFPSPPFSSLNRVPRSL
ncbi:hypothetical protein FA10DRAFT_260821 [Acaromyces ingoldii]|uniref:Uncharacterized protein n=1 Tax=Acaromyces ingoldii TaxID=215250 RepID=A0A316YJU5_9BASI|nr:hypothetical protein FA10DRAFT_260821 [Acaromyces ingoldii]PWN88888.1 hypothetical protein FA10DRAFT_260821 [Acaromyces ingoldii]